MEAHTHSGPAELNDVTGLTHTDAICNIIRLHFLGAPTMNPGALVSHDRIAEGPSNNARPRQFVRNDCRSRAYIRLRIESQAKGFQNSANSPDESRVELLHAHAAVAGVTLDALIRIHDSSVTVRID